ncbi:MAG: replication protein [Bacteroidetes bacterium]|nr:replication protein [Bacteroidota bacterium]
MASPQLEDGYTRIANELLDRFQYLDISGGKWRIILAVIRCTYGFQKSDHQMSYDFLSKRTGLHPTQVRRDVRELIQMRILVEVRPPTANSARHLGLNKDYNQWVGVKLLPVSESAPSGVSESAPSTVSENAPHIKKIKKVKKASAFPSMDQNADNAAASFRSGQLSISKAESSRLMVEYQIGPDVLQAESEKMTKWINDNPKKKPKDIIGFVDRWLSKLTPKQPQVEKQPIQYLTAGEEAWVDNRV